MKHNKSVKRYKSAKRYKAGAAAWSLFVPGGEKFSSLLLYFQRVLNDFSRTRFSYDFATPPPPSPPPSTVSKLDGDTQEDWERQKLAVGRGGGGAKSHDSEKAWSSIAHSKLSDYNIQGETLFLKIGKGHRRGGGNRSQGVTNLLAGNSDFRARICKPFKRSRNRFPAWRNRFLGIDSWAP